MILTFNNKCIGEIEPNFFNHIKPLLSYWGLRWDEDMKGIVSAMDQQFFSITGLENEDIDTLKTLLRHTGVSINERTDLYNKKINVEFVEDQPVPITIQTNRGNLFYLTPISEISYSVQTDIHKSIVCKKKCTSYSISFRINDKKHVFEWICYLIMQIGLAEHFYSLASILHSEYQVGIKQVLKPINSDFAALQLITVPEKDHKALLPYSSPKTTVEKPIRHQAQHNRPLNKFNNTMIASSTPINPFKTNNTLTSTFNPFNNNEKNSSAVINPFQPKTYTARKNKE